MTLKYEYTPATKSTAKGVKSASRPSNTPISDKKQGRTRHYKNSSHLVTATDVSGCDDEKPPKTMFQKLLESDHHMLMVLSYCGVFLVYGMTDELLGPTLIELSCLVSRPLETTSWLFFSHDMGLLFGTLFGGLIVSR